MSWPKAKPSLFKSGKGHLIMEKFISGLKDIYNDQLPTGVLDTNG